MKKIIIATICIYGMPLLAMRADAIPSPNALLSEFGTNLVNIEGHLNPNAQTQNIRVASGSFPALLASLRNIELSLPLPVKVEHKRRVTALRTRVQNAIVNALNILSLGCAKLNPHMQRYDVASGEEQEAMIEVLNFLTEVYNNICDVQNVLSERGQQGLVNVHASLVQMRNIIGQ